MVKLKSILKNDTEYLREIILLLFCFSLGSYKLFFQDTNQLASLIFGAILYIGAFIYILNLVDKFRNKS